MDSIQDGGTTSRPKGVLVDYDLREQDHGFRNPHLSISARRLQRLKYNARIIPKSDINTPAQVVGVVNNNLTKIKITLRLSIRSRTKSGLSDSESALKR